MQQGLLADFIVARQLFAFWLPDLCQHGSPAHALFLEITQSAWQQHSLLSVIGYFAAQEVRGCVSVQLPVSLDNPVLDYDMLLLYGCEHLVIPTEKCDRYCCKAFTCVAANLL